MKNSDNAQIILNSSKTFQNFCKNLSKKYASCTKATQSIANTAIEAIKTKNYDKLTEICQSCLPDDLQILRAYIWKINLGYLPLDIELWDSTLEKKRGEYKIYKKFIKEKIEKELEKKEYTSKEILEQIIKDVYRTNTQLNFFFSTN